MHSPSLVVSQDLPSNQVERGKGSFHNTEDDLGMPPSKVGRGAGGRRISGTPKKVTPKGTPGEAGQSRSVSQGDQTSIPHLSCGYCEKINHTKNNS